MRGGEHAAGFGLCQGGRAGQAAGFGLEDLEVVIQAQDLDVASDRPFVLGHQPGSVVDLDGPGGQAHR